MMLVAIMYLFFFCFFSESKNLKSVKKFFRTTVMFSHPHRDQ